MAGMRADLFRQVCRIADLPSPRVSGENLAEVFGYPDCEKLIAGGGLIQAPHNNDVDITVDDEERSYAVQSHNGGLAYFSQNAGWTTVKSDHLRVYQVNFDWLLRLIMDALGISASMKPKAILDNKIWFLGSVWLNKRKTPVILGRRLTDHDAAESLRNYLQDRHSHDPALVLAISSNIPAYFQLPDHNQLALMNDAIDVESQAFKLQTQYLAEKMGASVGQPGFSKGCRTAYVNGVHYEFSKLQAEILEVLMQAGRHMHKSEIMSAVNSKQEDVKNAFRIKGQTHRAWNVIIRNDKKGNYWLEY